MWSREELAKGLLLLCVIAGFAAVGLEHCGAYVVHHVSIGWK